MEARAALNVCVCEGWPCPGVQSLHNSFIFFNRNEYNELLGQVQISHSAQPAPHGTPIPLQEMLGRCLEGEALNCLSADGLYSISYWLLDLQAKKSLVFEFL